MNSLSILMWNMLGSGASQPQGWMCPRPGRLWRERGRVGPRAWTLGCGSSSDLCFQAGAHGLGGPEEAGMRQKASLSCLLDYVNEYFNFWVL